jgi:hypothetical protein
MTDIRQASALAVRQVNALITGLLVDDGPQALPAETMHALYAEVEANAEDCLPVLVGVVTALLVERAESDSTSAGVLWADRAYILAACYPEQSGGE